MIRRLIAGLVVIGLAIGLWAVWPRDAPDPTSSTTLVVGESTITSTSVAGRTTAPESSTTTTTAAGDHVVTTEEEAEAILRELWFGWFEGIYNQDEERIKEVVGSQSMLDAGKAAFGASFEEAPFPEGVQVRDLEILRADAECLVTWSTLDISSFRSGDAITEGVVVMRLRDNQFRIVTTWIHKEDRWEQDCEASLEPLS